VRAYVLAYGETVEIPCEVRPGTRRDAVLCAAGANAMHGLRRTNADKRRAVETLLRDEEWGSWSDREITRRCHVSDRFVNGVRKALGEALTANNSQSERTDVTRHGTQAMMRVTGQQAAAQQRQAVSHAPPLALDDSASDALTANDSQSERTGVTRSEQPGATEARVTTRAQKTPVWAETPAQPQQAQRLVLDTQGIERVPGGPVTRAGSKPVPGSGADLDRAAELLTLYRAVLSTLGEYGALTGKHTHTPAVRRALEPLIEALKQHKTQ
jgi:hypothetical protein